jgi:hypothetical protein
MAYTPPVETTAAMPAGSQGERSMSVQPLQNSSGPLLHREENSYGGGWTPAKTPPPEPLERVFNLGGDPPEKFFESDKHGMVKEKERSVEKSSFFGVAGLWLAIGMVLSFSGGLGAAATSVVFGALALFILWAVLHSEELWAKWAMLGFVALNWLLFVGSFVGPKLGLRELIGKLMPMAAGSDSMYASAIGISVLLGIWLLAILLRDIRQLNEQP